eukprot:COSAG01_NODE_23875_length_798_cov_2.334764_1_plen_98_part_10
MDHHSLHYVPYESKTTDELQESAMLIRNDITQILAQRQQHLTKGQHEAAAELDDALDNMERIVQELSEELEQRQGEQAGSGLFGRLHQSAVSLGRRKL